MLGVAAPRTERTTRLPAGRLDVAPPTLDTIMRSRSLHDRLEALLDETDPRPPDERAGQARFHREDEIGSFINDTLFLMEERSTERAMSCNDLGPLVYHVALVQSEERRARFLDDLLPVLTNEELAGVLSYELPGDLPCERTDLAALRADLILWIGRRGVTGRDD